MAFPHRQPCYNQFMSVHVYLSPHLDDAVFSCGGLIAHQTAAGESVVVLTVCAGDPPPGELTAFAKELHARWGSKESPCGVRRVEDVEACASLSAGVIHLEIPDAIYRRNADGRALYPDETAIFAAPSESESELIVHLQEELADRIPTEAVLYCPLGYGGHVDHRLTRLAAEGLNRGLWYYKDLPYAACGGLIPDELGLPEGVERWIQLESDEIDAWVLASGHYRSQISTFWADENTLRTELCGYHGNEGGFPIIVSPD
jgi:hypothetical protein